MATLPAVRLPLKANVMNRVVAKCIDLLLVFLSSVLLPYPVGPLLGFFYSLFGDGMNRGTFRGQSLGKKWMKLQVIHRVSKHPIHFGDSLLRNAPVGVATFFAIIPVWGWVILGLIGLPLMVIEVYLMWTLETGYRLGDVMADTEVVELSSGTRI